MATSQRCKPKSLSLAFFNANGLSPQRSLVGEFLHDHSVDIMLVQETFLKPSHRDPKIANYNLVRNDRAAARGGGTLIYYKRPLHCIPLDPPALTNIEASVCRIAMTGHLPITVASVYLPPDRTLLKSDLEALFGLGNAVILAGDLNCKHAAWNSHTTTPNGRRLDRLVDDLNFDVIAPMTPTHYPANPRHRPDVLDMALLRNVALRLRSIETVHDLNSDHRPVLMQLGIPPPAHPRTKMVMNWQKLGDILAETDSPHLSRIPNQLISPQDTDLAIDALTSHLQAAIGDASSPVEVDDYHRFRLPDDVKELRRAKNAAIRAYDAYPTESNRVRMRALQRDVKRRISELRENQWNTLLEGIAPTHQAYWSLARSLKSDTVQTMPP